MLQPTGPFPQEPQVLEPELWPRTALSKAWAASICLTACWHTPENLLHPFKQNLSLAGQIRGHLWVPTASDPLENSEGER